MTYHHRSHHLHLSRWYAVGLLMLLLGSRAHAAAAATQDLTVTVTLTIASDISVEWSDNAGANGVTTAQSWALGTVGLNTPYNSDTQGTQPTFKYIHNLSNAAIDVTASCGNSSPSAWVNGAAAAANQFKMEAKFANTGGYSNATYYALNAPKVDIINNLPNGSVSGQMTLQLTTPSSITIGGGLAQTVTVTFTCTADNGD